MKCAVLASGPSMSDGLAQDIQSMNLGLVVVVNDTFRLAPWADALAAQDAAWWRANPDALQFAGQKFSSNRVEGVGRLSHVNTNRSSGVLALEVAVMLGATAIDLYGFDMHGDHFFGRHTKAGLKNTTEGRFQIFQNQFAIWRDTHDNVGVTNRTPGSRLQAFAHG